jgi:uncharacterized protein YukE
VSVSGHAVGGLPGGGRLVDLIDKVTGDPGVIRDIARRWTTAGSTSETAGSALSGATGGVDGAWQGPAADAFVGYMNGFVALCDTTKGRLDTAAGVLEQAATLLESTKSTVENRCDALVTEAASLRADLPADTPPEEADAQIAALVDQVYNELRPIVDDADSQLAGLAGQLDQPAGDGFARYPTPDTAAFVPQPGLPIQWAPQPPESTQPAGDSSSTGGTGGSPGGGGGGSSGGGSSGGFGGYGASGPPPPGGGPAPQGQVAEWIRQAIEILKAHGYPVEKMNPNDIWMIIQHESGGDPTAINNWDSNAAKGTPSKGLMQTIDPTFNAHALPGHTNIYNPVDNIIAGVRYAIDRYGSVSNVPGVVGVKTGSGYRGY